MRRFKCANQKWELLFQRPKYSIRSYNHSYHCLRSCSGTTSLKDNLPYDNSLRRYLIPSFPWRAAASGNSLLALSQRSNTSLLRQQLRFSSSEGDGRNASEDKLVPAENGVDFDKGKLGKGAVKDDLRKNDAHAQLGEQDQQEWLKNEKMAIESKKGESPFLSRREKFKNEFSRRVVPWEKITVSWESFPYYVHEHTKNLLVECAASHLKQNKSNLAYGSRLASSSGRILLQSVPGTELYRERLVRALARDLKVPLLVLDSNVLAPYDFGEEENESDDEAATTSEDCSSESEAEEENNANTGEEWASSGETKSDNTDDDEVHAAEVLKKLDPNKLEEFAKQIIGESESSSEAQKGEDVETSENPKRPLRKGDRVKYIGPPKRVNSDGREVPSGQRGEVYEVDGEQVAVILDSKDRTMSIGKEESSENTSKPSICWMNVKDVELDLESGADCYAAIQALCEVLQSRQPLIVYFPDSTQWLSRAVPKSSRKDFVHKVQEMFDHLSGPVILICGQNKIETGGKEKESFTMILPNFGRLAKLPLPLRRLTEGLKANRRSEDYDIYKLFMNVICVHPPKDEEVLRTFNKQLEDDRRITISRSNLNELHKVLEEHELFCSDLLHVNTDGVILTRRKAERVVGWARNHYLASGLNPSVKGEKLNLPRESIEIAISRLKEQETITRKPLHSLKNLAKDEYESNFVSAVVPPGEIGVKFDDVGALEDVKKALNELVILPMKRPELFSHGNLLRPCKGILLFGPPGTGKTLLAKALATEAGANFISITGSTLTSKWFGDAEKLTKALFSFASKLAPVIIFVDEVDSLLGARGGGFEHEATRRMRNEFMAAWDGLRTKDSQRILILGATNRPFDLDDAVIRRLPRRIYVDLPDAENRLKILKIFLAQENLEPGFQFDKLANVTEGYSGSDLKNLCIAASYRPVQELLEEEKMGLKNDATGVLRPLNLDDFIQSKVKVGPSVAYDATSMNELRKWNDQYGEGGSRKKSPFGFGN